MRLKDKVALITGGGSGIGRASALLFAQEGASVVVADVHQENGEATAEEIRAAGGNARFQLLDVSNPEQAEAAIGATVEHYGRLDVLFNNAGISGIGDVEATDIEVWDRVMAVNVRGVFLMSRYAVHVMRRQGGGVIINMSSFIADMGLQQRVAYGASKGAVLTLTRCMAADHSAEGIRVCALLPGTVYTPFVEGYLRQHYADRMEETLENLSRRQLNNKLMMPEDVAKAALFLASDDASFALGTALTIDGGVTAAKVF